MGRCYKVGEFAALVGVSVRTLHHYDRIGLLKPSAFSEGGHRLYSEDELLRLQQILTLRYLGFPLARIGELLDRPDFDLLVSMQIQRTVVRDRISELESIESALESLIDHRRTSGQWDWNLVLAASTAVQRRKDREGTTMEKYYTDEQMRQFDELGQKVGQETIQSIEQRWTALIGEVRSNLDLDPAGPEARSLADRWTALTEETMSHYRDYPELSEAIGENYRKGSFENMPGAPGSAELEFIGTVNEARKG